MENEVLVSGVLTLLLLYVQVQSVVFGREIERFQKSPVTRRSIEFPTDQFLFTHWDTKLRVNQIFYHQYWLVLRHLSM